MWQSNVKMNSPERIVITLWKPLLPQAYGGIGIEETPSHYARVQRHSVRIFTYLFIYSFILFFHSSTHLLRNSVCYRSSTESTMILNEKTYI